MTHCTCPVCGSDDTHRFLRREKVPVHQNLLMVDPQAARAIARGTLEMVACRRCGFVFNRSFDPDKLSYGNDYDNTQSCSAVFAGYLDELVRHLIEDRGIRNCRIVEVGCGKGQFLRKLVEHPGSGNLGIGFDPSYVGPASDLDGRLRFERRFYGADEGAGGANEAADVVICRHVIEHVQQPLQLLKDVRLALANSPGARVFFETPCVEWILRRQVIWDLFFEHCSLFTASSLASAFALAGFHVESIRHLFGDQYLWIEATVARQPESPHFDSGSIVALADAYALAEQRRIEEWRNRLLDLAGISSVAVWGAGAKGATFLNLVDPDCRLVDCVVDLNPGKQGRYVPGTGHPIVDYRELGRRGIRNAVLMNPNYRAENLALLLQEGISANLLEWN